MMMVMGMVVVVVVLIGVVAVARWVVQVVRLVMATVGNSTWGGNYHERQHTNSYSVGIKIVSSMCLSQCPVSPVKTGQDMDFSGHFEDALGRVLGHFPGLVLN